MSWWRIVHLSSVSSSQFYFQRTHCKCFLTSLNNSEFAGSYFPLKHVFLNTVWIHHLERFYSTGGWAHWKIKVIPTFLVELCDLSTECNDSLHLWNNIHLSPQTLLRWHHFLQSNRFLFNNIQSCPRDNMTYRFHVCTPHICHVLLHKCWKLWKGFIWSSYTSKR